MNAILRVAAAQGESVPGDLRANVATAAALVGSAADRDARVVVLPELFLTGYAPAWWGLEESVTPDDATLEPLRRVAADRRVVVVAGAAVRRAGDRAGLGLLVVDDDGQVTAPYDKQHLSGPERDFFVRGAHGASLVVDGWELALGVCYDGSFPEHAAAAADDGALAYLCPSAYYVGSEHRRDLRYAARALDNGLYVVFAGLAGRCGEGEFSGGSAVYDPEGRCLVRAGAESPAVVVADLDAAAVARARERDPIRRDRLDTLGRRARVSLGAR